MVVGAVRLGRGWSDRLLFVDHAEDGAGFGASGAHARPCQWRVHVHRRRLRGVPCRAAWEMQGSKDQGQAASERGRCLKTPFGTFNVPNISPDKETGIGNWSTLDFVNAMKRGIAPGGVHLYPAFPYTSYQRMAYEDLIDLKAYLDTLPAVKHTTAPHELTFPYTIRRGLGLWQLLYVDGRRSSRIQNRAPKSIAGRISLRGPAIAASVIRRGILSVGSFRARPLRVRAIRKARVGPPTSRRVPTASTIGARTISPTCSRLATRRTSTWSVVPWRRFRRIWRSSSRKIALQSPPI